MDVETLAAALAELEAGHRHPGPEFGTEGWAALEVEDPRRGAAVARAAFAWFAQEHGIGAGPGPSVDDEVEASHAVSIAVREQREQRRRDSIDPPRCAPAILYPPRYAET